MNRIKTSAFLIAALALPGMAREISPQEALIRAKADSPAVMTRNAAKGEPRLAHTAVTENGRPAVYVFNNSGGQGYMALSADDAAAPVLGYADNGTFAEGNLPPQLEWWLGEYSRQIEYARENGLTGYKQTRAFSRSGEREAIAPMIKTMWDQVAPYNDQCPLSGSYRTWTGCVATSMAQVMNYWKYPEKGTGSITYSIESLEKKVTMNFGDKKFDWDNMLNQYENGKYTEAQAEAVAYLMKACGYSVKMQYDMDSSGALAMNIGNALVKYFNYDGNLLYTLREYYSTEQWNDMVYQNLKNVGPMLYGGGSALGGGHSFVVDGYDGDGYFHFNWGWSGMSDGYYLLDALNPDALGSGGGTGGGYNFTQDCVFGIQPPTGQPVEERPLFLTQEGEISGSLIRSSLSLSLTGTGEPMWVNYNPVTLKLKFGAMFYPQGDTAGDPIYHDVSTLRLSLQPGYGTNSKALNPSINLSSLGLSDGTYKVVMGTVPVPQGTTSTADDGEGFVEVKPRYGMSNSVVLHVNDGKYTVDNSLLKPLKIKGEVIGDLYYGALVKVKVTAENPNDIERVSGFAPVFMDAQGPLLLGESIFVTVPPKSTVTREWSTTLSQFVQYIDPYLNSEVTFTFFDEVTYDFYTDAFTEKVMLKENPGKPIYRITEGPKITNSFRENDNWMIVNPMNIEVTAKMRLVNGYFNYPVVAALCIPATDNQVEIVTTGSQNVYMSTASEDEQQADVKILLSYPPYDIEQQYYMAFLYSGPSGLVAMANPLNCKFIDPSGIGEITASEATGLFLFNNRKAGSVTVTSDVPVVSAEAYDMTGRRVDTGVDFAGNGATLAVPTDGVIIIRATDANGNARSFKVN